MSNLKLRPYQAKAFDELYTALAQYHRVIFCLPTGGGKGFLVGAFVERDLSEGKRVLILSSRTEILKQNIRYVSNFGYEAASVNPKVREIPTEDVVVSMAQTLARRVEKKEWREWLLTFDKVYIDEAHEQVSDFVHPYLRGDCEVVGMTATPHRYGKAKHLGEMYYALVEGVTVKDLIGLGYLAKPHLYSVAAPTLDDVERNYVNGEYNQQQLARKFEDKQLYVGLVSEFMRVCPRKKTICFCVSSKQAIEITKEFNAWGVSAKYVLSGSFDDDTAYSGERSSVLDEFDRNEFQVLVNVGCFVAGFDQPDVECVILNYATTSLTKYRQSIGRGARTTETKKDFWIIDCGANYKRLGKYEDDQLFCLWHDEGSSGGIQMLKVCDPDKPDINGKKGCGTFVPNTCKVCPKCGRVFVTEKHESIMHLEEVASGDPTKDLNAWAAQKYHREGWNLNRVFIQIALANPNKEKAAVTSVYRKLFPQKTPQEVNGYWWMFKKQFMPKLKRKTA